jgi:hypothetical protein
MERIDAKVVQLVDEAAHEDAVRSHVRDALREKVGLTLETTEMGGSAFREGQREKGLS